jgi:prepilin-type N-terminal cleavage/methylation domain-containing protein
MRPSAHNRGFTLVELLVSMSIGTIVMLAVFSTYTYLGRNLTRLSYQSTLESQSRKILNTLASDIRNAKSIKATNDTGTGTSRISELFLILYNTDASKGTVPTMEVVYKYSYDLTDNNWIFTRDPDGSGLPNSPVKLNYPIGSGNVQLPVTMPSFSFLFYTTSGGDPVSQFASPAPPITPISIKQVAINFTLKTGNTAIQGQQGTLTSFTVSSGRMPLLNRPLPDGT